MREKKLLGIILTLVLVTAVAGCARFRQEDRGVADLQALALNKLRGQSERPPKIQFADGIPRFVSMHVPVSKDVPNDPVLRALDFLERYRDFYGIANPRAQLYLEQSVTSETGQHIFFGQRRDEMPVFGAQLAVHLNQDAIIATNGNYLTDIPHPVPPAIDEKRAEIIALKDLGESARRIGLLKLVYFSRRLFMTPSEITSGELDSETHQAWRLNVVNGELRGYSYFIDAQTGDVLYRLNLSPDHAPQKDFHILTANDLGAAMFCGYASPTDWFDENGVLPGAMPDPEGNNAFSFTHRIYDFFFTNFHRHSWKGNDNPVGTALDFGVGRRAAFVTWCGQFIFSNGMATLDVMAHEITHGITSVSAGGGLIPSNQSGALSESYSDVFASLVDNNWTIGEGTAGPSSRCLPASTYPNGTSRDLSNPPACTDPDVMTNFRVMANDMFNDFGGIHINNGIPNKAAFLIAAGGTHSGIIVSGIGRPKTAQLYYEVLTSWLTRNADFNSARNATVTVARIWSTSGKHGFTSTDVCVVVNAFAAVGLGIGDVDCDGVDDNADPDDDGDTIADSVDNCIKVANPGQLDTDKDKQGDACDLDRDGDGYPNTIDNCPLVAHPYFQDFDKDGIGDLCDDSDGDGVVDLVDNCRYHKNPNPQSDIDNDGLGDACDNDIDQDAVCNEVGPTIFGLSGGPHCAKPDNCSAISNPTQADRDSDGMGDVCDGCFAHADSGIDTDLDGKDNVCDFDDDNDGILDIADNCATVKNPDQRDFDRDSIGAACDPNEGPKLGSLPSQVHGAIQFRREAFETYQILLLPDICPGPNCLPDDFFNLFVEIKVQLEMDLPVRIVDDQGFVVAQSERGLEKVLRFRPEPYFFYRLPGARRGVEGAASDEIKPYQGRHYFLEILPTREVSPGRFYKISVEATSGTIRSSATLP